MTNNFKINQYIKEAFLTGANTLFFPLSYIDLDNEKNKSIHFNNLPNDLEFKSLQGFQELSINFWSEKEKKSYWIKLPFHKINNENKLTKLSINNKDYIINNIKVLKYNEYLNLSQGHVYMNIETYKKEDVTGNSKYSKSSFKFMKFLEKYTDTTFFNLNNSFVLMYKLEMVED